MCSLPPTHTQKTTTQEARVYLFNDAVLVSTHRLGKSVCKEFLPLSNIEIVKTDPGLGMFGLHVIGDEPTCHVFRSTDVAAVKAFLAAILVEMNIAVVLKSGPAVREEVDL